jgi:hypothetical protein
MDALCLLSYEGVYMERVMGIEPTQSAWEADILPLNYTRMCCDAGLLPPLAVIPFPRNTFAIMRCTSSVRNVLYHNKMRIVQYYKAIAFFGNSNTRL